MLEKSYESGASCTPRGDDLTARNESKTELRRWMDEQYRKDPELKGRVGALVKGMSPPNQDVIASARKAREGNENQVKLS